MKNKTDSLEYFGALRNNPMLDTLEEDSRKIREMARLRFEYIKIY